MSGAPDFSAVEEFKKHGYVVVPDMLPLDLVAELRTEYLRSLRAKMDRLNLHGVSDTDVENPKDEFFIHFVPRGGNHDVNRWNMHLPSRWPFLDPRVYAHPRALPILHDLLGEDCVAFMLASDTACPGSEYQNIHRDFTRFGVSVNIPLCDVTPEMGPIELWPQTHLRHPGVSEFSRERTFAPENELRRVVSAIEPVKMHLSAGSALIRDHRLVHRGTPNRTEEPRPQLSIYYLAAHAVPYRSAYHAAAWCALRLRTLARGSGPVVERPALLSRANRLGRIAEECALTDRDFRRPIPKDVWDGLPTEARHLLRFALVDGARGATGSLSATTKMTRMWLAAAFGPRIGS